MSTEQLLRVFLIWIIAQLMLIGVVSGDMQWDAKHGHLEWCKSDPPHVFMIVLPALLPLAVFLPPSHYCEGLR